MRMSFFEKNLKTGLKIFKKYEIYQETAQGEADGCQWKVDC